MAKTPERRKLTPQASAYADAVVELTQMTFDRLLPAVLLTGMGLPLTTALLAAHYGDTWLWVFTALIAGLALVRVGTTLAFSARFSGIHAGKLNRRSALRWQVINSASILCYCLAMAGCTLFSFWAHDGSSTSGGPAHNSAAQTLCMLGTLMICAGLASRVGLYPRVLQAGGLLMLLALAIALLSAPDPLVRAGVLLILLFGYAYFQSVQNRFDAAIDQIRSRRTLGLLSNHDTLTGLFNRRHFEAVLATTCLLEEPFAILFIDIEGLAEVNQEHGRAVGDILIQRVGVRLKNSVRRGDVVARVGGDEFSILQVQGASDLSAQSLSRRIHRAIAAPFEIDGRNVMVSASVFIRLSTPGDKDPHLLLDRTNESIYAAEAPQAHAAPGSEPPAARTA
jgi:diguanylate cyclase (GGDEF)-like protein